MKLSKSNPWSKAWLPRLVLILFLTPVLAWAQEHTLNLKDVDIRVLIDTVAEITGESFIVDPAVEGRVTVIAGEPLDEAAVYELFQSVLQVHGYATVPSGQAVKIVPEAEARQAVEGPSESAEATVTRLLPLEHVTAPEMVTLIRPLLPQSAHVAAHGESNSVLITARAENVRRVEHLIRRIDRQTGGEVEVAVLSHANAEEVARLLERLGGPQGEAVIADPRTNSIIIGGDPSRRLRLRTLISHLDTPVAAVGNTRVMHLNYADADALIPVLQEMQENAPEGEAPRVRVSAHPETNSLIVTASPAEFRAIEQVVRQLDVRRAQVLVEAIIAEVSVDASSELGIQWQVFDGLDDGDGLFGGTSFGSGGSNILNLAFGLSPTGEDGLIAPTLPNNGLSIGYVSGITDILGTQVLELGALLRALAADSDTNVLSTPSIVTLDNHEASIHVGQEVPFISGQFTSTGIDTADGAVNPFQTITREEIGIKLTVTPHINEGDTVLMDISQEVSSLVPSALAVDLITNKRTVDTSVLVPDGAILVLGGLISDDVSEDLERVPGLSRIPLFGELFKFRSSRKTKRNLMVFIRPRILRDDGLMDAVSAERYRYIRAQQMDARERAQGLTPAEELPLLPELYDYLQAPLPGADPIQEDEPDFDAGVPDR